MNSEDIIEINKDMRKGRIMNSNTNNVYINGM